MLHLNFPGRRARQTCPADVPGRRARKTCPADVPGRRMFGRHPAIVKHSKEHKKQPKIGEFLPLKVGCTAQRRIRATKFDFVKYIIVKLI
jgi:hypothetical protein